jgi:hypothetical protein
MPKRTTPRRALPTQSRVQTSLNPSIPARKLG